jgi:pimeloyl-ACP methyl ester carboxylesterase
MKRWILRSVWALLSLLAIVAVTGSVWEAIERRKATSDFPPLGVLVDVGGRNIQLDCRGHGSPTVVFESGLDTNGSLNWIQVQDDIAKFSRACSYSRAGILWSDPGPGPRNGNAIAFDLHAALDKGGEKPPFVLVGHSMGGPYAMTYVKYFGDQVAGVVLVDASNPDQGKRFIDAFHTDFSGGMTQMRLMDALSWTGIIRLQDAGDPVGSKDEQTIDAYEPQSFHAILSEIDAIADSNAEA